MSTPTEVKAPVHFVRTSVKEANGHLFRGDTVEALTRLDAAIQEASIAIERVGDAFNPASLVLTAAKSGSEAARTALLDGSTASALGATRATLAALDRVPAIIEAHTD